MIHWIVNSGPIKLYSSVTYAPLQIGHVWHRKWGELIYSNWSSRRRLASSRWWMFIYRAGEWWILESSTLFTMQQKLWAESDKSEFGSAWDCWLIRDSLGSPGQRFGWMKRRMMRFDVPIRSSNENTGSMVTNNTIRQRMAKEMKEYLEQETERRKLSFHRELSRNAVAWYI